MAKASRKKSAYRSVGETFDGITILKPKTKPTAFTTAQIRSTIARVLGNESKANIGDASIERVVRPTNASGVARRSKARRD